MAKAKQVNYEFIGDIDYKPMYDLLHQLQKKHHPHLEEARIALAWRKALKADPDGKLILGKCKKASDLDKEFHEFDFVILLNKESWQDLSEEQRAALVDHELCHAGVAKDKDGAVKRDERGRIVYRLKKHDIEEFEAIVDRHGFYKKDLEVFAETCVKKRKIPLFAQEPKATEPKKRPATKKGG